MSAECYTPGHLFQVPFGKRVEQSAPENDRPLPGQHIAAGVQVETVDHLMALFHDGGYDEIVNERIPFGPPPIPSRARDEIAMVILEVTVTFDSPPYKGDIADLIAEFGIERCWYHANWLATRVTHAAIKVENVGGFFKRSVQGDWDRPEGPYVSVRA